MYGWKAILYYVNKQLLVPEQEVVVQDCASSLRASDTADLMWLNCWGRSEVLRALVHLKTKSKLTWFWQRSPLLVDSEIPQSFPEVGHEKGIQVWITSHSFQYLLDTNPLAFAYTLVLSRAVNSSQVQPIFSEGCFNLSLKQGTFCWSELLFHGINWGKGERRWHRCSPWWWRGAAFLEWRQEEKSCSFPGGRRRAAASLEAGGEELQLPQASHRPTGTGCAGRAAKEVSPSGCLCTSGAPAQPLGTAK